MPATVADNPTSQWLRSRARRLRWDVSTARRGLRKNILWPWPPEAVAARHAYKSRLWKVASATVECEGSVPLEVYSFSSRGYLPEQVASIRSFLSYAGRPASWTVVSDGSHSDDDRALLQAIHPCVEVVDWRVRSRPALPQVLWDYARIDTFGKKLMALVSLPADRPLLYTDADVLFYPGARESEAVVPVDGAPRYIEDSALRRSGPFAGRFALDHALLNDHAEGNEEVNSGFILLNGRLDWAPALQRLDKRRWRPETFTEQTVVHLTLRRAGCRPLDPDRYVLAADDRYMADDPYVGATTVLRHYVSPVRHKFWTAMSREGFTHDSVR